MKFLKLIWFVLSISMIGSGGYFLYENNKPEAKKEVKKETVVKEDKDTGYAFRDDRLVLGDGVTATDALEITKLYDQALVDSWLWMPEATIDKLDKLDNEYRLTLASNRIAIDNASVNPEKEYPLVTISNKQVMTKTQFKVAWEDTVGLDVAITYGNPCTTIKGCTQYYKFNQAQDYYEVGAPYVNVNNNYMSEYLSISENNGLYSLEIKAVYADYKNGKYEVYTNSNKNTKITELTYAKINNIDLDLFNSEIKETLLSKANTYIYTFKKENGNFLFSGYDIKKQA